MTNQLKKAFAEASKLPKTKQDELASIILDEIAAEGHWDELFAKSQDQLGKLADEALEEFKQGKTKKLGWDEL